MSKSDAHHLEILKNKLMELFQVQVVFKCLIYFRHLFISCLDHCVSIFKLFFLGNRGSVPSVFTFQWYGTKVMKLKANHSFFNKKIN